MATYSANTALGALQEWLNLACGQVRGMDIQHDINPLVERGKNAHERNYVGTRRWAGENIYGG